MTTFAPGDKVRITAKGLRVARERGEWVLPKLGDTATVKTVYGRGRTHQVYAMTRWWPARCWEKI